MKAVESIQFELNRQQSDLPQTNLHKVKFTDIENNLADIDELIAIPATVPMNEQQRLRLVV